jgi:hypothetical protein
VDAIKLYMPPSARYFGCRHCHDLTYQSRRESHRFDRIWKRMGQSLGWELDRVRDVMRGR